MQFCNFELQTVLTGDYKPPQKEVPEGMVKSRLVELIKMLQLVQKNNNGQLLKMKKCGNLCSSSRVCVFVSKCECVSSHCECLSSTDQKSQTLCTVSNGSFCCHKAGCKWSADASTYASQFYSTMGELLPSYSDHHVNQTS